MAGSLTSLFALTSMKKEQQQQQQPPRDDGYVEKFKQSNNDNMNETAKLNKCQCIKDVQHFRGFQSESLNL